MLPVGRLSFPSGLGDMMAIVVESPQPFVRRGQTASLSRLCGLVCESEHQDAGSLMWGKVAGC